MGISIGDRLGRYEILGALGSGGMGDVYRARDPQLRRDVAIKVLLPHWSGDPVRQRRLEHEARAAASLNHPNIVTIYDVGLHDGRAFVVAELLQGQTLRECLRGRALPLSKAVEYATHIATGLAAGHERGITHRDIKPENVFVTRGGLVKILDFGLAIQGEPEPAVGTSATVTLDSVQAATFGGTATYMSPEQARGLRADYRSDIFSLASVFCEMLTGAPPFRRETAADTQSAILNEEPRGLGSVAGLTPALERIIRHCLEKRPEDRFQNARDLIFALQSLSQPEPAPATAAVAGASRVPARRRLLAMLAAGAALLAAIAGYVAGTRGPAASASAAVHGIRRLTELPGLEEFPAISPDGRAVAFTADVKGRRQLFVRLLAGGPPLAITKDAVDHEQPRWSPDGNSLVYFSRTGDDGAVWAIPALGGSPRRLMASLGGADVSRDGRLACFRLADGRIQLVTAGLDGSDVRVVLPASAGYHRHPRWSPDSKWIAFQRGDGVRDDAFVVAATGGNARRLTNDRRIVSGLAWLPASDGIVFASSRASNVPYLPASQLWTVRLDGSAPSPLTDADASYEQPDVHASGLVSAARVRMQFDIWRFPVDGSPSDNVARAERITRQTGQVLTPTVSPDDGEVAFLADHGGHANLWVLSTPGGELRQVTFESDPAVAVGVPVWSPDGRSIVFVSSKGRSGYEFGLWAVNPDGGNLRNMAKQGLGPAWSPDGQWLYYSDASAGALKKVRASGGEAVVVRNEPTRNVIGLHDGTLYYLVERPLVDGRPEVEIRAASPEDAPSRLIARIPASRVAPWQIVNPTLSPDGQWMAMPLNDGFTTNIWTLSTKTQAWRQVTDFGGRATFIVRRVSWSPDGRSILAAVGDGDADVVLLDGAFLDGAR